MTKKIGSAVIIESTEPAECEECGKTAELRPYGKNGKWICFQCGMKDEAEVERQFKKLFDGGRDI